MSLFSRIISISDVQTRLHQLDVQVDKLEEEDLISRNDTHLRRSFTKRCRELYKQINDYKNRVKEMKKSDNTEVQRLTALEQLDDLQVRLLRIAPERDRASSDATSLSRSGDDVGGSAGSAEKSVQGKTPINYEPSSLNVQETPVLAHTPQPQSEVTTMTGRRGSLMYEAASDGEDEEHDSEVDIGEESEEASSTPVKAQVQVPTLQPAPRVKKEVTPVVTAPVVQSKSSSASSTKTVVSPAGVVDALLPEEGVVVDGSTFIVLANLRASQPGDLSISEGEILKIVQTRPDGWWMARNSSGVIGLVPKTYLRHALPMDEQRKAKEESKETTLRNPRTISSTRPLMSPPKHLFSSNQTPPTRQARCLGDAQLLDPHLSFACHLTPRLSHSNIGFHDLYWNYRDDKLRKRRVRVSKLVRLVRLEGMPKQDGEVCLVRAALYDRSRRTGRQIVSNVHTIRAQVKNRTWTFNTRTDTTSSGVEYGDFIVRSNYNMTDVVLVIEASHVVQTQPSFEERSLGIITIDLISKGEVIFSNKTYCETLRAENIFDRSTNNGESTPYKIVLKVLDVPQELVPFVDSMPDVLLFNPMFVRLYFFFRRRAGTTLLRDRDNLLNAEMISDPFLALFPSLADQPDVMDQLRTLWNVKLKVMRNKPESEQAASFFQLFMNTAYCVHNTALMPPYRIWDMKTLEIRHQLLKKCEDMLREYRTSTRFLLTEPCLPLNVYDYSFDLLGRHALD